MRKMQDLQRLQQLAALKLDAALSALTTVGRARQTSLDQLAGLAIPESLPADLSELAGRRTALTYQRWAESRRAEINLLLARQTADWLTAQDAARIAFGQTEALRLLANGLAADARRRGASTHI